MAKATSLKTKVSTKGQVLLPRRSGTSAARPRRRIDRRGAAGRRAPGPSPKAEATRVEDVFGPLGPVDRNVSIEEMNEGVLEEARRRWLRKTRDSD